MCKGQLYDTKAIILAIVAFRAHLETGSLPPPLVFLIDTGAEKTMVSAVDAEKLGIQYQVSTGGESVPFFGGQPLELGPVMGGVGGGIKSYKVPDVYLNLITLLGEQVELHGEHLDVLYVPEGKVRAIPSLLGMDIICRFKGIWDLEESSVDFTRIAKLGTYQCTIVERSTLGWI